MANNNTDIIGHLLQEVFTEPDGLKILLETLLGAAMTIEAAEHLKADNYQRSPRRIGYRNGYKPRTFAGRVGKLHLQVPQVRGCLPYQPSMYNRFQRSERALYVACAEMYFQGVSTRKVQDVLNVMCGMEVSSATVSRIASELDEKLKTFRSRRLDHNEWSYLQVDARYEKVRVDGHIVSQAALVAVGITSDGRREILDWRIGDSESEDTWGQLFRDLRERGLNGLKIVVSDAHSGIRKALARYFQAVRWQRCRVHFKRDLLRKIPWKRSGELMADIVSVFEPENRSDCMLRGMVMADKWRHAYPSVAKLLEEGLEDCLTVCSLDENIRRKMNSTNMLENLMRRLKARTRVVGIFPNRRSCDRLIGALLLEVHEEWQAADRPYLNILNASATNRIVT
jgi:transposase-like protein